MISVLPQKAAEDRGILRHTPAEKSRNNNKYRIDYIRNSMNMGARMKVGYKAACRCEMAVDL